MADVLSPQARNVLGIPNPVAIVAPSATIPSITTKNIDEMLGKSISEIPQLQAAQEQHKAEQAQLGAEQAFDLTREVAKKQHKLYESPELQEAKEAQAKPFIPTKETAGDLGLLFTLTNLVGFAIGGRAKGNAQAAMSAMNGMLEGHQKGRDDLYKREKDVYDENMKQLDKRVNSLYKDIDNGVKMLATDREAGMAYINQALSREDAKFVRDMANKFGYAKMYEVLKATKEQMDKATKLQADEKNRAEQLAIQREQLGETRRYHNIEEQRLAEANKGTVSIQNAVTSDGKTIPVLVNNRTGKITDVSGNPFDTSKIVGMQKESGLPKATKGSALQQERAYNIAQNFDLATRDLLNVTKLPAGTTLGAFAGMTGQGGDTLMSSLENTFARAITSEDQRNMQQIISGLDQNLGRVMGSGYASSTAKGLIKAYQEQVSRTGDSPAAQALFLARVKQELSSVAQTFKNHPGANQGFVDQMKENVDTLNNVIPFDVADVLAASKGQRISFLDEFKDAAQGRVKNYISTDTTKPMPTGDKLKSYADAHFGGDIQKSIDFLKTQGYE